MKTEDDDEDDGFWVGFGGFAVIAALVTLSWFVWFFLAPRLFPTDKMDPGLSGDMFGSLTALFSGLAFAGLISTLLMQQRELGLQRRELNLTRAEFERQRFESTLFNLIRMLNEHTSSIKRKFGTDTYEGRHFFEYAANEQPRQLDGAMNQSNSLRQQIEQYSRNFDNYLETDFAPYMRLLYGIFRHIESSPLSEDKKRMYSKVARAQLSSAELLLIMFDCADGVGEDFQEWIKKYGLLKHVRIRDQKMNPDLVEVYGRSAFERDPVPHTPM